jgi:hypothetical protein
MLQVVDNAVGVRKAHLSGCGGAGGSMPTLQIVTPLGMSTITLTASSGSVTPRTIQLTLTVH